MLPAIGIPVGILCLGLGIQAAAFHLPSRDTLVTTAALRELLRYRVMRSSELVGGRAVRSVCVDGWFRPPSDRRPVRGALVLLGNGEKLYDIGHGIHRIGHAGPVSRLDRARFLLAGCPLVVGENVAARLIHGRVVDPDPARGDGLAALSLGFGHSRRKFLLLVEPRTYVPIALRLAWPDLRGLGDLTPGGGAEAVLLLQQGFDLPDTPRPPRA